MCLSSLTYAQKKGKDSNRFCKPCHFWRYSNVPRKTIIKGIRIPCFNQSTFTTYIKSLISYIIAQNEKQEMNAFYSIRGMWIPTKKKMV